MKLILTSHPTSQDSHNVIGFYGEPKAPAYLAKTVSFYGRLFLFPFSVKWSESQRTYKVTPFSAGQKALFILFVFGNTISFLFWISTSFHELTELYKSGESLTAGVLVLLCLLLTWLSVTTTILIIWLKQEDICQFLRELQDSLDVVLLPSATVWLCPVLFYFASCVTNICSTTGQITVSQGAKMMTDGIFCFLKRLGFFPETVSVVEATLSPTAGWLSRGLFQGLEGFFKVIIFHGGCYCSLPHTLLLSICFGLRQVGKEVKATVDRGALTVYQGLQVYQKMKRISNATNSVFGAVMLTHYMCNLTYAIQTPFLFHEAGQIVEDVNYLLWLIVSGLIWWTGSEFHRLVQEALKNWIQQSLSQDMSLDDRLKLSILSNSIDKDNLGLYCRYFLVTHRFLTTTCGAVLTYGIIVLQVQVQPVEPCRGSHNEIT